MKAAFFEITDNICQEIRRRFNDNSDILLSLAGADNLDSSSLKPLEICGINLPNSAEITVAKAYIQKNREKDASILTTILPIKAAIPAVYDLFTAVDTFGCSTAVCEASFSALSRIGVVRRMSMTNKRLRQLSLLAFESKFLDRIPKDEVLKKFNETKHRRVQLY